MLEIITEQELAEYGVVSAPDELKGRPADAKAIFDRLVTQLVAKVVNDIINAHNALDADVNERIDDISEELRNHVDVDPSALTAANVAIEAELAEQYGLSSLVPTVHNALERALEVFVRKTGGTMTGPLEVVQDGTVAGIIAELASATILAFAEGKYSEHRRQLSLCHSSDLAAALLLADTTGGTSKIYNVLHTGNLEALGSARIAVGSYNGTGVGGVDNPNRLSFPFAPKFVLVHRGNDAYGRGLTSDTFFVIYGVNYLDCPCSSLGGTSGELVFEWGADYLSWYDKKALSSSYPESYRPVTQLNDAGVPYRYFAIG